MARGDIPTALKSGNQANKILSRTPFESIPMTVDFSSVQADTEGYYKVKAGTPISAAGVPLDTYTNAVGILLNDVYKDEPAGAILKKGYIDKTKAAASSGITWDDTFVAGLKAICPMYVIE